MKNIETLISKAQGGDRDAMDEILHHYSPFVKDIIRYYSMFLNRDDREDLYIEGLIGLQRAVMSYKKSKAKRFEDFSYVSVKNAIFDYLRRRKRLIKSSLSFYRGTEDFKEELILFKEDVADFKEKLSPLEQSVLELYMQGYKISDIAEKLGKKYKSIDNALQRIKRRLRELFLS